MLLTATASEFGAELPMELTSNTFSANQAIVVRFIK